MKNQSTYIFESPDGGSTVYRRNLGSTDRELIKEDSSMTHLMEDKLWGQIRRGAKTDPELQRMLDQIKIYWHLKNTP